MWGPDKHYLQNINGLEVAFDDNVIFEKYFRGLMVCFSHVWNPRVGDNLSAEISQIYLTYVIKDQYLAKEQAGREWNSNKVGRQKGQLHRRPWTSSTWATILRRCHWVPNLISLTGDLSLSQKRLLKTERIKKNNIVKKRGCWACTLLAGIPLSFLRAPQISFILGQ